MIMMLFRRMWLQWMAIFMLASSSAMAADSPKDVIQKAADSLIARLVKERPAFKKDPQILYNIVEENIQPYVDFDGFAKGVMGQYYRQATDKQRAEFTATFRKSLIRTYANGLAAYDNQKFTVKPYVPGDDPKKAQVDMDIQTASNGVVPVTYQLALGNDGQWRVRNLIVNGMNLGLTFRNQFASTVEANRGNLDQAIVNFIPAADTAKKGS